MVIYLFLCLFTNVSNTVLSKFIDLHEKLIVKDLNNNQCQKFNKKDILNGITVSLEETSIEIYSKDIHKTIRLYDYITKYNALELFIDVLYEIFSIKKLSSSNILIIRDKSMVIRRLCYLHDFLMEMSNTNQNVIDAMIIKYKIQNFCPEDLKFSTVFENNQSWNLFDTKLPWNMTSPIFKFSNTIRIVMDDDLYIFDIPFKKVEYFGLANSFCSSLKEKIDKFFKKPILEDKPSFFDTLLIDELSEIPYTIKIKYDKSIIDVFYNNLTLISGMEFIFGFSKSIYEILRYFYEEKMDAIFTFMVFANGKSVSINNYIYCTDEYYENGISIEKKELINLVHFFIKLNSITDLNRKGLNQEIKIIQKTGIIRYIFKIILHNRDSSKYIILLHFLYACDCISKSTLDMISKIDMSYSFMKKSYEEEIERIIDSSENINWLNIHSIEYAYLKHFIISEYNLIKNETCNPITAIYLERSRNLISYNTELEKYVKFLKTINFIVFLYFSRNYDTRNYPDGVLEKTIEIFEIFFNKNSLSNKAFDNVMMKLTSLRHEELNTPHSKRKRIE